MNRDRPMTAPAPKPMQNDPERMDILRGDLADLLEEARKLFKYPEERRLTILVRQAGEPERDCVVTDDTPEGVLEIVSRRFPRPQQSAEPVAWLIVGPDKGNYTTHFATVLPDEARQWRQKSDSTVTPLFAASPGPSELVEEMEKLESEMRGVLTDEFPADPYRHGLEVATRASADKLRALITRHRGKS